MLSAQPVFILREVLQYLDHQRVVAPGYTYLQDMIGRTVAGELLRITRLLGQALKPVVERQLEALLQADEGCTGSACSSTSRRISAMASCVRRYSAQFFQQLFEFGQIFLASAGLSNESVKYYASLVEFYTVYKLQRMAVPTPAALCFASHRFRRSTTT